MDSDMVTPTPNVRGAYEPTTVMRARARNAERFQMYMASSLRVDERDPHLQVVMSWHGDDMGIVYYLLDSGDVLAFPMTAFNNEVEMHRPELNPMRHPFKGQ